MVSYNKNVYQSFPKAVLAKIFDFQYFAFAHTWKVKKIHAHLKR